MDNNIDDYKCQPVTTSDNSPMQLHSIDTEKANEYTIPIPVVYSLQFNGEELWPIWYLTGGLQATIARQSDLEYLSC